MNYKNKTFSADVGGEVTTVRLLSHPDKQGRAKVKILKSGIIEVNDGAVEDGFQFQYGLLQFKECFTAD